MNQEQLPEGTDRVLDTATAADIAVGGTAESSASKPTFTPAPDLTEASGNVEFEPEAERKTSRLKEEASKLKGVCGDKARDYAETGKEKATNAIDSVAEMVREAAGSVDSQLGAAYGDYVRTAADSITSFSETIRERNVDDFIVEARTLIRKNPAVAIAGAAALGFILSRVLKAGDNADIA